MKVLSDVSVIVKIAFVCIVVGFVLGLCASIAAQASDDAVPTHSVVMH